MSTTPTNPTPSWMANTSYPTNDPGMGLDHRVLTLGNLLKASRAMHAAVRRWERGEDHPPSARDLLFDAAEAVGATIPWDARDLAEEDVYETGRDGGTLTEQARVALTWMNGPARTVRLP